MANTLHKNQGSNNNQLSKLMVITAIVMAGLVSLAAVWTIAQSDCGSKLHIRVWPHPNINLEKLACEHK